MPSPSTSSYTSSGRCVKCGLLHICQGLLHVSNIHAASYARIGLPEWHTLFICQPPSRFPEGGTIARLMKSHAPTEYAERTGR
jgi:hypothetical protein